MVCDRPVAPPVRACVRGNHSDTPVCDMLVASGHKDNQLNHSHQDIWNVSTQLCTCFAVHNATT